MAEATDRNTTSNRISWDEALTRAGSSEILLSFLREVPVLAWHQGLYYWPSGKTRSGPGKIDPDSDLRWAEARVDPATRRVIFLMDDVVSGMIGYAQPADGPSIKDEVFAFGIELERGVIEVRFSATTATTEPPASTPEHAPAQEKTRAEWLVNAMKARPKHRAETVSAWARELQKLAQDDPTVEAWPDWESLRRDLYRQMDK
jgi:hypothetical protein